MVRNVTIYILEKVLFLTQNINYGILHMTEDVAMLTQ